MKILIPERDSNSFIKMPKLQSEAESIIEALNTASFPAEIVDNYLSVTSADAIDVALISDAISKHFGYPVKNIPTKQFEILAGPVMR